MPCQRGEHQHLGARGVMLQCHPISDKHEKSPKTRHYHLLALNQGAGDSTDEFKEQPKEKEQFFTPEQQQILNENKKRIKQFISKLSSSKFGKLFVPVVATMTLYDSLYEKSIELDQKVKSKEDQKIARSYQEGIDEIYEIFKKNGLLDEDINTMSIDKINAISGEIQKKHDELLAELKKKGGRKHKDYGKYRAFHDFTTKIDERKNGVERRHKQLMQRLESARQRTNTI